jgi:hypothetical protein
MRKTQHRKILELLQLLSEADSEMKRLFLHGESESVLQILSDCQSFAVALGKYIKSIAGKGTKIDGLLEDYCDVVDKASVAIGEGVTYNNYLKKLVRMVTHMVNIVRTEMKPDKIEVVFLPYKASMWDSLESVYLAAKDDPQCDAYVISIPYYDRLPNGTLGQMHCESGEYPSNIPMTDWRSYPLEERHPDVIVIMNPYDDGNYVTSVHPAYYSNRLKNCCDLLAYVPYFVNAHDNVPPSFCLMPGVLHADVVFVQSERARENYADIFANAEQEFKWNGKFGKPDKFIVSGSPKIEKVMNATRTDYPLPEVWDKLFIKPDGSRKKGIFYNTTIAGILSGNEHSLQKLQHVIGMFKERQDELVLWWRPHPLIEATLESMRPTLFDAYEKIVTEYKTEGWGIFDDTPHLHRAICWTDLYYGDASSVDTLYHCTGKNIIVANTEVCQNNVPEISFNFLCDNGDKWYTILNSSNALVAIHKKSYQIEYISSSSQSCRGISPPKRNLYTNAIIKNNIIYFAPFTVDRLDYYNIAEDSWGSIEINLSPINGYQYLIAAGIYASDNSIYLFPWDMVPVIVKVDLVTHEVCYLSDWYTKGESLDKRHTKLGYLLGYFAEFSVLSAEDSNTVLALFKNIPALMLYHMNEDTAEIYHHDLDDMGFAASCFDGRFYWLLGFLGNDIYRFDPSNGTFEQFPVVCQGLHLGTIAFQNMHYVNDKLYLIPSQCNDIVIFHIPTETFSRAYIQLPNDADRVENDIPFDFSLPLGDTIMIRHHRTNFEYNVAKNELQILPLELSDTNCGKIRNGMNINRKERLLYPHLYGNYIYESDFLNLETLLDLLKDSPTAHNNDIAPTIGKFIYSYMKEKILPRKVF